MGASGAAGAEQEGGTTVQKVEAILKSRGGMDNKAARLLAIDIVSLVAKDLEVTAPKGEFQFGRGKDPESSDSDDEGSAHSPHFEDNDYHFFEEFHLGEDEPDFKITIKVDAIKIIIGVLKNTTVLKLKEELLEEAGLKIGTYYLRWDKRSLEDHYSMEDYGIDKDTELSFIPKLVGAGPKKKQRDEAGAARGRQTKDEVVGESSEKLVEMIETLGRVPDDVVQNIIQGVNLVKTMQTSAVWARLQMKELETINGFTTPQRQCWA